MKAREQGKTTYEPFSIPTGMGISVTLHHVLCSGRGWVLGFGCGWAHVMGLQLLKPQLHVECQSFCYCCRVQTVPSSVRTAFLMGSSST